MKVVDIARDLGISRQRVNEIGRQIGIQRSADGGFDPAIFRDAWEKSRKLSNPSKISDTAQIGTSAPDAIRREPPADVTGQQTFTYWQARHERAKAEKIERENRQKLADLVNASEFRKEFGSMITSVQSRLLLMPAKVAQLVAVEEDVLACQAIITGELRKALAELSQYVGSHAA